MKLNKKNLIRIAISFIATLIITWILSWDVFIPTSNRISDFLYQNHKSPNSEIVIIGMDEKALEEYGAMPWPRDVMAKAINVLNSDESKAPAVIGIDALYTSESTAQMDEQLVAAVANAGNVVTASSITFGDELITLDNGEFYMDKYSVLFVEKPFEALDNVSKSGFLNAMLDTDAILRHVIWTVSLPDGEEYSSFSKVIYEEYMDYNGLEAASQPITDSKSRWYLPFTSKPGSYSDGFSVADLINGKLDPDLFAGKIVLIGPYTLGMNDEYFTAIEHAVKMYGVEYQANAIAALINGDLKTEVLDFPQLIMLFAITFLALIYFYEKNALHSTIAWLLFCGGWVLFVFLMWQLGFVFHVYYVPTSITICYVISIVLNYLKSTMEKSQITKTFRRYVAPQIVEKLLNEEQEHLTLGGKNTEIAVMFADIRGFTSLSEKIDVADVSDILNEYLSMMCDCVFENEGTVDKFIGDSVMAFWGAPLKQEDALYKSIRTAMMMIEKSKLIDAKCYENHQQTVGLGIGINYGFAVVGNFGSANRMDYTAIGDTVNVAARLQSTAGSGEILVNGKTAQMLKDRVKFTLIGSNIKFKGKNEGMEIYKVEELL